MATTENALFCAALATLFWGGIGLAVASWLPLPRSLVLPLAPTLGWAIHSVIALPLFFLAGMTGLTVSIVWTASIAASLILFWKRPDRLSDDSGDVSVPVWALALAGAFSAAIMLAILPKLSADGAALAQPIFDHAKVAMIDEMARAGVPAANPFFGEAGGFGRLSYYYLWHFGAAELVVLTGLSGWEADAGMTGFTALSSLLLMIGFAVWLSSNAVSAGLALLIAATTSMRSLVTLLLGVPLTSTIIGSPSGFGTWLFQIFWAPQHVASATAVVIGIFLLMQLAKHQNVFLATVLGLLATAAFESSTWVGGVAFPLGAAAVTPILLLGTAPDRRWRFLSYLAGAGVLAVALAAPFLVDQLKASALRGDGFPIAVTPFEVLDHVPTWAHTLLDVPAYWTVFLFVEFAAFYPAGLVAAAWMAKDQGLTSERRRATMMLGVLAIAGLCIGGLLMSTTAPNNDLAWRGVLPSVLVLIALTAAGFSRYLHSMRPIVVAGLMLPAAYALAQGLFTITFYLVVKPQRSAPRFLQSTEMWSAVRKHTGLNERVANNPQYLADMTNWAINISWALLANRRSCYAGRDLALPFAPLTRQRRDEIDAQFARVFTGAPEAADINQLAARYDCTVVVLTPEDGAWSKDPFAGSQTYRLIETQPARWRIYRRVDKADAADAAR